MFGCDREYEVNNCLFNIKMEICSLITEPYINITSVYIIMLCVTLQNNTRMVIYNDKYKNYIMFFLEFLNIGVCH